MANARKNIDFLLLGVPRSGTSALVRALNFHPNIFCGMELLDTFGKHTELHYPTSFESLEHLTSNQKASLAHQLVLKPHPLILGNKQPRYYFNLPKLVSELPTVRIIWLYRSPIEYVNSWNRRALNDKDLLWERGQTGVFGIFEILVCANVMVNIKQPVTIVPYEALYFSNPSTIDNIYAFLGLPPTETTKKQFDEQIFRKITAKEKEQRIRQSERYLLNAIDAYALNEILNKNDAYPLKSVRGELSNWIKLVEVDAISAIKQATNSFTPEEMNYFIQWKQQPIIRNLLHRFSLFGRIFDFLNK